MSELWGHKVQIHVYVKGDPTDAMDVSDFYAGLDTSDHESIRFVNVGIDEVKAEPTGVHRCSVCGREKPYTFGCPCGPMTVDAVTHTPMASEEEVECLSRLYVACREENETLRQGVSHAQRDRLREDNRRLREVLIEIADGYERHNPGWWIKKAKAALAGCGA